jgi:dihydroflavonol-4-reductase
MASTGIHWLRERPGRFDVGGNMRVMITGGTGFIGYHTTMALLAAGHKVSLLVRSVDKMLNMYGENRNIRYTRGDICDVASVKKAMKGCDAVIHTAAMVSTSASDAERVYSSNVQGAHTVIGSAIELGMESIIHVSSVTALFDPAASVLDENTPPGTARNAYGRSKVACERYVRECQEQGAPVYITYPATVIGPDDPGMTEAHVGMHAYLTAFVPLMPSGNQYVDVRDVAEVHLRLLEQKPAYGRYLVGGNYLKWAQLATLLEEITGRRLMKLPATGGFMRFAGRTLDRIRSHVAIDVPVTEEAMDYATRWVPMDNSLVEETLGFTFRPAKESMADTIRWLYDAAHISRKHAGAALDSK